MGADRVMGDEREMGTDRVMGAERAMPAQTNILETIAAANRERVAREKALVPAAELRERAEAAAARERAATGKFVFPFEQALRAPGMSFICECKKASPSKGLIAPDYDPVAIARDYEAAGAAAISCLTEPRWFQGSVDARMRWTSPGSARTSWWTTTWCGRPRRPVPRRCCSSSRS